MKPARKTFAIVVFLVIAALSFPKGLMAAAGGPQICNPSATCTIGEFVYDDSYQPINSATCTITSRYPDSSLFLDISLGNNSMSVSGNNDGWYAKTFTAPATTGLYRTQVCCLVGTENMCLDKSFEVKAESTVSSSAIATAVWGYSGRTLSSFGSLATDVWSVSSRTLSSFGDLVSSFWNNSTRTLSGTSDVAEVKESVDETRILIEKLVNRPIIENVLEEKSDLDLSGRLKETRAIANQVYVNGQYLTTEAGGLLASFSAVTAEDIIGKLGEVEEILGVKEDTDTKNSIYGGVNWFTGFWGWQEITSMKDTLNQISGITSGIKMSVSKSGKSQNTKNDLARLVKVLLSLERQVGKLSDTSNNKTLYGNIKRVEVLAQSFDSKESEINNVLGEWKKKDVDLLTLQSKVKNLISEVLVLSQIPKTKNVLGLSDSKVVVNDPKTLKNTLLGLQGLIKTNRVLLARGIGKTSVGTWLEEGSIVFKTLATNPSSLISQDVAIKYYLPQEIREEDVISMDEGLEVRYDSEKDQYFVSGNYTLTPGQTKVISVRTQDIWVISDSEVESLKAQAGELNKPLEKTAFFAQGITLKSDIVASLDKITTLQEAAITPEQKIRAFREASIEKKAVLAKMDSLKALVTQASSTGSIFGFVGGAQAVGVWGIVIVIAAGFVFLAIYMKNLNGNGGVKKGKEKTASSAGSRTGFPFKLALPVIIISSVITAFVVSFAFQKQMKVLGAKVEASQCQSNVPVEEKVN